MSFLIKSVIKLDTDHFEKNVKKTGKQVDGFGKNMKTVANGVKAAWAGVALMGLNQVFDAIVDVTKAAADDNKSMAILNETIKRSWKGNSTLNKSIDEQIDKMSNLTGIADDKLRPALVKIAQVTKTPAKGMKFLSLSADIAAKSGKNLNTVSQAMAKYLGGNKTALDKFVPGLKEASDKMGFLNKNYKGFAETAGQNDPFGRITVIMDNFKEKLGQAFLPMANSFADWLAGPEAQAALDDIAKRVQDAFAWVNSPEGKATISEWVDRAGALLKILVGMVDGLTEFLSKMPNLGGRKTPSQEAADKRQKGYDAKKRKYGEGEKKNLDFLGVPYALPSFTPRQVNAVENKGATIININGMLSANEVISELGKLARKKGVPISKLFA